MISDSILCDNGSSIKDDIKCFFYSINVKYSISSRRYMFLSKMKLILTLSFCLVYLSSVCIAQNNNCEKVNRLSGVIRSGKSGSTRYEKCWIIKVPEDNYLVLDLKEMNFKTWGCPTVHVKFSVIGTNEEYSFCSQNKTRMPRTFRNDVKVSYFHHIAWDDVEPSFTLHYDIGLKLTEITGVNTSRENVIAWLKSQQTDTYGWGLNTHRAITALYLSGGDKFQEESLEDKLLTKQLELQIAVALIRNADDPISLNEISMFINALSITCRRPRHFYGQDLLEILSERVSTLSSPSPGAFLTLCNANTTISESQITSLLDILSKHSDYPFHLDIQAMTHMALTCIKSKINSFYNIENATEIYNAAVENFISRQQRDGSFGNVYTTAVVTQALLSSGQENNREWNMYSTTQYLMSKLNSSSIDFLSAYFVAPIFNGKTLVDLNNITCEKNRKEGEDKEVSDIIDKLGAKMQVKYYLYVGDKKDVVHSIHLRVPKNSSAYDIMRVAQAVDHKYKFYHNVLSDHVYVYEIAGMTNDPETEKFWLMYIKNSTASDTLHHCIESPDKLFLKDGDHLVMWYKTAKI